MNKAHLELDNIAALGSRQLSSYAREVDWPVPDEFPASNLVELYTEIENALNEHDGFIIQFVSITPGHGGELIALDMAFAAATILKRNILVLNATTFFGGALRDASAGCREQPAPTGDSIVPSISIEAHIVRTVGHGFYMADLHEVCGNSRALASTDAIAANLRKLSSTFDAVVVASPPTDVDPFSMALARHVDANLLVIEAEQTHRSEAIRVSQMLSRCGQPLIGTIFNNRIRHIPRWLAPG